MPPIAPQYAYSTSLEPRVSPTALPSMTIQLASLRVTLAAAVDEIGEEADVLWIPVRFLTPKQTRGMVTSYAWTIAARCRRATSTEKSAASGDHHGHHGTPAPATQPLPRQRQSDSALDLSADSRSPEHPQRFHIKRELNQNLSGNEVYFTGCCFLVQLQNSCSNCQTGVTFILFLYQIPSVHDPPVLSRLARRHCSFKSVGRGTYLKDCHFLLLWQRSVSDDFFQFH